MREGDTILALARALLPPTDRLEGADARTVAEASALWDDLSPVIAPACGPLAQTLDALALLGAGSRLAALDPPTTEP